MQVCSDPYCVVLRVTHNPNCNLEPVLKPRAISSSVAQHGTTTRRDEVSMDEPMGEPYRLTPMG